MPYLATTGLGADDPTGTPVDPAVLERLTVLDQRTALILAGQARAESRWKWQTAAAIAGALFAAVKLGLVAFPKFKEYRPKLGTLGALRTAVRPNPRRRGR